MSFTANNFRANTDAFITLQYASDVQREKRVDDFTSDCLDTDIIR